MSTKVIFFLEPQQDSHEEPLGSKEVDSILTKNTAGSR